MQRPDRDTLDRLAAEYVLGTLAGPARVRFERWIETDPEVTALVAGWERRLATLAHDIPEATPSPALWQAIAHELGHVPKGAGKPQKVTRRQFWFGFGSAAATASVVGGMVGLLAWPEASFAYPTHYSVLRDRNDQAVWLLAIHDGHGHFRVHPIDGPPAAPAGLAHHLWLIPGGENPVWLGAVKPSESTPLPPHTRGRYTGATVTITHERSIAEPVARPSAPPVYRGTVFAAR